MVTRAFTCPGGRLVVNADATSGELQVRLTDYERLPLSDFTEPSQTITGDNVRHEICWEGLQTTDLKGRELRLEFAMKGVVDLYSFCFSDKV